MLAYLFRWLGHLSLPALHRLGALTGLAWLWVSPGFRTRLRENMGCALGRPPTRAEMRANAIQTGCMILELPYIWQRPLARTLGHVIAVEGWEKVEALRAQGRAMIVLTPHLGCFEIISHYVGERQPMTVLYRPPRDAAIDPIMRAGREQGAIKVAAADLSGVRRLIRALRQGEAIGLLPDQVPGNGEGLWSPFFGKPAYTMTLAARLSEVSNTGVLMFWGERIRGQGWRLHVFDPAEAIEGPLEARVHAINRNIEAVIRQCPEQYLWAYKRYKVPAGIEAPAEQA